MILVCQLPADVMLFFGVFPSNLFFTSMGKIGMNWCCKDGVCSQEIKQITHRLQPKYSHFPFNLWLLCLINKTFNTDILNFHQYFNDKLSSHQPSHMHTTRHKINSNMLTPLFNRPRTEKKSVQSNYRREQPSKFTKYCTTMFTFKKTNKIRPLSISF